VKNSTLLYLLSLLIAVIVVFIIFAIWKYQYTKYNLLRLNPLDESVSVLDELRHAKGNDSVIWFIGDSRIAQWNLDYLKQLNKKVINLGVEGQTSKQTLENFRKYLDLMHPYCVVIQVGINDFKVIGLVKSKTNEIVSNCYSNTVEIISLCRNNNIAVIYMAVIPTGNIEIMRRLIWSTKIDTKLDEFNQQMKDYCLRSSVPYFDVVKIFEDIPCKEKEDYQKGFLHLSDKGYKYLSEKFIHFYYSELYSHKQK